MNIRNAESTEIDALARLWHDAWQDGHAAVTPEEIKRFRTLEYFRERITEKLSGVRVTGPVGEPLGLCIIKDDELDHLFVSAAARGKGVAAELVSDAEKTLAKNGVTTAWLTCVIGNDRAARFYEKSGWHRAGNMFNNIETPNGLIELEVWRYEKSFPKPQRSL